MTSFSYSSGRLHLRCLFTGTPKNEIALCFPRSLPPRRDQQPRPSFFFLLRFLSRAEALKFDFRHWRSPPTPFVYHLLKLFCLERANTEASVFQFSRHTLPSFFATFLGPCRPTSLQCRYDREGFGLLDWTPLLVSVSHRSSTSAAMS